MCKNLTNNYAVQLTHTILKKNLIKIEWCFILISIIVKIK